MTLKPVLSLDPDNVVAEAAKERGDLPRRDMERKLSELETPPSIPDTAEP